MKFLKTYSCRLATVVLVAFSLMSFTIKPGDSVVVIVNTKNQVGTMTLAQVKDVYMRKTSKRWKEMGSNIVPLDIRGDSDSKNVFLTKVLQMSKLEMYRYFTEREYQNQETPPVRLYSDDDIIKFVQENSGAIGYVMKSAADGKNVKIVCVVE